MSSSSSLLSIGDNVRLWLHTKLELPWQGARVAHVINSHVLNFVLEQWPSLGSDTTLKIRLLTMFLSLKKSQLKELQPQLQKILTLALGDPDEWISIISSLLATMIRPESSHVNYEALEVNQVALDMKKKIRILVSQDDFPNCKPSESPLLLRNESQLSHIDYTVPCCLSHFTLKKRTLRFSETREKQKPSASTAPSYPFSPSSTLNGSPHMTSSTGMKQLQTYSVPVGGNTPLHPRTTFQPPKPFAMQPMMTRELTPTKSTIVIMDLDDLERLERMDREQELQRKMEAKQEKSGGRKRKVEEKESRETKIESKIEPKESKIESTKEVQLDQESNQNIKDSISNHKESTSITMGSNKENNKRKSKKRINPNSKDSNTPSKSIKNWPSKPADLSSYNQNINLPSKPADLQTPTIQNQNIPQWHNPINQPFLDRIANSLKAQLSNEYNLSSLFPSNGDITGGSGSPGRNSVTLDSNHNDSITLDSNNNIGTKRSETNQLTSHQSPGQENQFQHASITRDGTNQ